MLHLPYDIKFLIYEYIPFEQVLNLDKYIAKKLYKPNIHTWEWAIHNNHINVIHWFCLTRKKIDKRRYSKYIKFYINNNNDIYKTIIMSYPTHQPKHKCIIN
jgi:hypothetical protein